MWWQVTDKLGFYVSHGLEELEWSYVVVGTRTELEFGRLSVAGSLFAAYPLYDE